MKKSVYDQMQASAEYSRLIAEDVHGLADYIKPYASAAAMNEPGSYDHYMCMLALFNAYAYSGDSASTSDTLKILDAVDVVGMSRMPETISFDLTALADFDCACQLVITAINVIDDLTVDSDYRTLHLVPVYATKLNLLVANDVTNGEIPELLVTIRTLSFGYKYYNEALIRACELLLPAGILKDEDAYTLYSLWTFMKVDERFYGNYHPDDLAKVDGWIRQLYPPPKKFIFQGRC